MKNISILGLFILVFSWTHVACAIDPNPNSQNYYERIGANSLMSQDDLKSAFRKAARQYHPDLNPGNATAELNFKKINEAWEVLSNPKNRKIYDVNPSAFPSIFSTKATTTTYTNKQKPQQPPPNYKSQSQQESKSTFNSRPRDPETLAELIEQEKRLYSADDIVKLKRSFVDKIKSPEEFLKLMQIHGRPNREFQAGVSGLIADLTERFYRLGPSLDQISRLEGMTSTAFASARVRELGLRTAKLKSDYLKFMNMGARFHPEEYLSQTNRLLGLYLDHVLQLKPTNVELEQLASLTNLEEPLAKIKRVQLKQAYNADEFIRLAKTHSSRAMGEARQSTMSDFFNLKPSLSQVVAYNKSLEEMKDIQGSMELRRRALRMAQTSGDYEKLFARSPSLGFEYNREMDRFVGENFSDYLKTKPEGSQVNEVLQNNVSDNQLRKLMAKQARSHMGMGFCLSSTLKNLLGGY